MVVATIAKTSATMGQRGGGGGGGVTSNLQGFQAHHPPTYMGEGDSMVRTTLAIRRGVYDTEHLGYVC